MMLTVCHRKCGWTGYEDELINDYVCPGCKEVTAKIEWEVVCQECGGAGEVALDMTAQDTTRCFKCEGTGKKLTK